MVERMGIEPVIVCSHVNKKCLFSALQGLFEMNCPRLKTQSVPQNVTQKQLTRLIFILANKKDRPPQRKRSVSSNNKSNAS